MIEIVKEVVSRVYKTNTKNISKLGGGFYGRVYLAEMDKKPYKIILKIYLYDNLAIKEKKQLGILAKHSLIPIPEVYFLYSKDEYIEKDVLIMEYLEGVNAGLQEKVSKKRLDHIADRIVDNLISYHSVTNEKGFGEIGAVDLMSDWREYYKIKIDAIYENVKVLKENGNIDSEIFDIITKAYSNYYRIFYLPIKKSSLIHGDYNTWNIMLNKSLTDVVAVIDPYNCCWGDPEFDLYQLNNANGKYFSLLERYLKKRELSENFDIKLLFYELFTEIMHYYDANVDINKSNIESVAVELDKSIDSKKY